MAEVAHVEWLNAIPAAVFLHQDDRILFANRAAATLAGWQPEALGGVMLSDLLSGAAHEGVLKARTGVSIPVEITSAEVEYEGQPATLVTLLKRSMPDVYRTAIENSLDSFFLVEIVRGADGAIDDLICIEINDPAAQQITIPQEHLIGQSVRQLLARSSTPDLFPRFIKALEQNVTLSDEIYLDHSLIREGWYQVQLIPMDDRVAIFCRDVTIRRAAEDVVQKLAEEVEQQARMLDEILAATPDRFILFDRQGHYLFVNRKGLEDAGLTIDQVLGKTWRELGFPEEVGLIFEQRLERVFSTGESITYEEKFPTTSGLRDFLTTLTPIHDREGRVAFMLNTIHDITERKEAEEALRDATAELERQARVFNEVLSTTPDTFLMFDRDSTFIYASPSALRNTNLKPQQVLGKTWRELGFPQENGERAEQQVRSVFETGETIVIEETFPTINGLRDFESIFAPLRDDTGNVTAVVVTNRDITERKGVEEALRASQRLFTSLYETALVGIAVIDTAGNFVQVNRTYCDIYGYTPAEMIGRHFTMILPTEAWERARLGHDQVVSGETPTSMSAWTAVRKGGERIDINAYNNLLIQENDQRFRVVVIIDTSEQKRAQRALEESEQRLTSIFASMQDVVWSVEPGTHELIYVNPTVETFYGYPAAEVTTHRLLNEIIHPDDREDFIRLLDDALGGAPVNTDYRIIRRDGETRWVHNRFWLVRDAQGSPQRIDGIMTDITDRRQASDQAMELAIERERVRIMSDFVRDASHEFRTPLSVINTRLYLMEKVKDPIKQTEYIDSIKDQTERILKLVESLIMMSRLDSATGAEFEQIDLNSLLTVLKMNVEAAAQSKQITFTFELAPETFYFQGETSELMTAFNAIFDNAVNYTASGGEIGVRCCRLNDHEFAVDVRDTGMGIDAADLPLIFDRFYRGDRARPVRGFGLGLTIARKIVERHGGRIEVESQPDVGSLFRLIFPIEATV